MINTDIKRPLILVSNDDGIDAPGVHRLIDYIREFGDVVCVCPDGPRSGQSMAITMSNPLRLTRVDDYNGARMYKTNGTPVDCVKLAVYEALERKPDLVVSGINHGSNAAINVVYSGTMGAAFEGCAFGIPAIGFSITNHDHEFDLSCCEPFVKDVVRKVLAEGLPSGVCLNVNIPDKPIPSSEMRLVRACKGNWSDEYDKHIDENGEPYYLLTGTFTNEEPEATDTDDWCLANNIVSVVAVALDRTIDLSKENERLSKALERVCFEENKSLVDK